MYGWRTYIYENKQVMSTRVSAKTKRIEVRVAAWQKDLLQEAATIEGLNLSDYILLKTIENARATVDNHQQTDLSLAQQLRIADILAQEPAKPTPALLALQQHYRDFQSKQVGANG